VLASREIKAHKGLPVSLDSGELMAPQELREQLAQLAKGVMMGKQARPANRVSREVPVLQEHPAS